MDYLTAREIVMEFLNEDLCRDCLLKAFDLVICDGCGLVHLVEETSEQY